MVKLIQLWSPCPLPPELGLESRTKLGEVQQIDHLGGASLPFLFSQALLDDDNVADDHRGLVVMELRIYWPSVHFGLLKRALTLKKPTTEGRRRDLHASEPSRGFEIISFKWRNSLRWLMCVAMSSQSRYIYGHIYLFSNMEVMIKWACFVTFNFPFSFSVRVNLIHELKWI